MARASTLRFIPPRVYPAVNILNIVDSADDGRYRFVSDLPVKAWLLRFYAT